MLIFSRLSVFLILLFPLLLKADDSINVADNYFYHAYDYGSEAVYNPVNLILNCSYDVIQLDNRSRNIFDYPYSKSAKNLWKNLKDPINVINKFGWYEFIESEIFPFTLKSKKGQWWPNYQLHLIGGGMTYTALKEWYEYHGCEYPWIPSVVTTATYHILNELVENQDHVGRNVDPIADIYFFDILGIWLFSYDNVNKFFSEELNMADWSMQPSFVLPSGELHNNGQYFSVKWYLPFYDKAAIFYYFGMNALIGASYRLNEEYNISFGAGLRARNNFLVKEEGRQLSVSMVWNAGLFYDRNNSLLASLHLSGLTDNFVTLNIYPGVVKFGKFSPGLWGAYRRGGNFIFGLTTVYTPGIGYGR